MSRPVKHFAYQLGRDLHMDVDIIMSWPLKKIYEYMAFYITEDEDWKKDYVEDSMTDEQRHNNFANILGAL